MFVDLESVRVERIGVILLGGGDERIAVVPGAHGGGGDTVHGSRPLIFEVLS